jgi:hypothetical protein
MHTEFRRKCDEACARLFGSTAYCAALELEPFGELIPESFDAIRDGDKIVARVAHRDDAAHDEQSTVLSPDDWKAMRESHINDQSSFQQLVDRFAYQTVPEPERRRSRSVGDEDDVAPAAPVGSASTNVPRRAMPQPPLRSNSGGGAPIVRKPTRPVGTPGALASASHTVDDSDDFESAPSESDQLPRESLRTISAKLEDIDEEMARINAELAKAKGIAPTPAPAPLKTASARTVSNPRPPTRVVPAADLDHIRSARPATRVVPQSEMDQLDAFLSSPSSPVKVTRANSKAQLVSSNPSPMIRPSSPDRAGNGPPPKPQKSEQALIRVEQLKRGRSNAQLIDAPRGLSPPRAVGSPALAQRSLSPSRSGNSAQRSLSPSRGGGNNSGRFGAGAPAPQQGRAYAGNGPVAQLPHMPSRQPLFDGLPAPILTPGLAQAVTKTSGPFACPICFKSYPIAADVFHHVQKRHEVELLDAAAVNDANDAFHTQPQLQRTVSVNGSGQVFGGVRGANSGGSLDANLADQPLPPGWTRVWSKSKQVSATHFPPFPCLTVLRTEILFLQRTHWRLDMDSCRRVCCKVKIKSNLDHRNEQRD